MNQNCKLDQARTIFEGAGGTLTMGEAMKLGIHRRELYALRDQGDLEVVSRGLYRLRSMPDPSIPDFIPIGKKVPRAVICLISALAFHELTTQIPHFVYVALPSKSHKPAITYPPLRVFWYSEALLVTGSEVHIIDGSRIKIFNVEKTLVDCVKYRNKIGMDVVLEALKMYWKGGNTNLNQLFEYARKFRVEKILKPIMETITSE
jgi:predicted transcriptional regulator of viral defense system